jgi:RecA-family ATPase
MTDPCLDPMATLDAVWAARTANGAAEKPNGHDPNAQSHGTSSTNGSSTHRFTLLDASALPLVKRCAYLVKNIIPTVGLIVVWGPPKCGKSFWVLNIAFHIALGWEYRGRRVKQGLVIYIGCEGAFAVPARIEAFRQAKINGPIDPERFRLILSRLDLVTEVDRLIADIEAQIGYRHPAVLVIDTLNRSLAGSESSDADMGNYVKAADKLRERFDCAVIIIHHCGYNTNHPRGHTSLTGAADAQIAIKKDANGLITTEVQ